MTKRILTYTDACLLITAFRNEDERGVAANIILNDERRDFVVSDPLWLELMPKPLFYKRTEEADFYASFFGRALQRLSWNTATQQRAHTLARTYGLSAMDAIHVAYAIEAGVDEFVSAERITKPMFRVLEVPMTSIALE